MRGRSLVRIALLALVFGLQSSAPVRAQDAPKECPTPQALRQVAVTKVSLVEGDRKSVTDVFRLRQEIAVTVRNLRTLLDEQACSRQQKKIVLYLDGRPLVDRKPYPPTDPEDQTLHFSLDRKEESRDIWTHLLGRPSFAPRDVKVSVGMEDEYAVPGTTIRLEVISRGFLLAWCLVFVGLLVVFGLLAARSNLLRDQVASTDPPSRKPYSLARMQIAVWFFITLASYLFIGIVTGDFLTSITGTVLALLGISAGTAIGSSLLDGTSAVRAVSPDGRPHWYLDILSDENGVNFHRFQMAAWTLVLAIIFVHEVYDSLAMPAFDNTLLGLLGISSGTYLGLKGTTEKKDPDAKADP